MRSGSERLYTERERELQRKERWDKIRESRYNKWFKEVKERESRGI